jgi:hypothetical protein
MGPNVDLHVGGVDEGRERHGSRVGRNSNLNMTMMTLYCFYLSRVQREALAVSSIGVNKTILSRAKNASTIANRVVLARAGDANQLACEFTAAYRSLGS